MSASIPCTKYARGPSPRFIVAIPCTADSRAAGCAALATAPLLKAGAAATVGAGKVCCNGVEGMTLKMKSTRSQTFSSSMILPAVSCTPRSCCSCVATRLMLMESKPPSMMSLPSSSGSITCSFKILRTLSLSSSFVGPAGFAGAAAARGAARAAEGVVYPILAAQAVLGVGATATRSPPSCNQSRIAFAVCGACWCLSMS
mmetsp:Transcript_56634/g.184217  ORF Transcript_56634/g.184217 Transcript_56634/m.184217 type:complete len:201 (-) Transcript_56634:1297-1899(-)